MARLIKRYENRKLYDTQDKTYVSLRDVAALVRRGETVQVVDNKTGEDLTAQTLMQILLEEGKQGQGFLSSELLHDLLRRSGEALDAGLNTLRHGVDDLLAASRERLSEFTRKPRVRELEQLRAQLGQLESMLGRLLDQQEDNPNKHH